MASIYLSTVPGIYVDIINITSLFNVLYCKYITLLTLWPCHSVLCAIGIADPSLASCTKGVGSGVVLSYT